MGLYLRPSRFVRVRVTRRGVRWAIGPRAGRLHLGAGGPGVSTGAGPFSGTAGCGSGAAASRPLACRRGVRLVRAPLPLCSRFRSSLPRLP
jgi:hypothetical protein